MNNYWTARKARFERNQNDLLELAKKVKEKYPSIEIYVHHEYPQAYLKSITFFKDEMINSIGFHEVPYHWSGCGYKEHSGGENVSMPFDEDDVFRTFKPITSILFRQPNEHFKSKEQYLKWYSFLKKFEPND